MWFYDFKLTVLATSCNVPSKTPEHLPDAKGRTGEEAEERAAKEGVDGVFPAQDVSPRVCKTGFLIPGSPADQTKWLVFRRIHVKDSLLPMGKAWSLDCLDHIKPISYFNYFSKTNL